MSSVDGLLTVHIAHIIHHAKYEVYQTRNERTKMNDVSLT